MKFLVCFFALTFLAACHGGGGHSPNTCADSGRGCPTDDARGNTQTHTPTDGQGRGDSSDHTPSDRNEPSRGDSNTDRGGKPSRGAPRMAQQLKITFGKTGKISTISVSNSTFEQTDNTNKFVNNDDVLTYNPMGKDLGLSYSEFGTYHIYTVNTTDNITNTPFVADTKTNIIDNRNIATDVHFTGRAVGNATNDTQRVELAGNATLDFDKATGTSALGASFNNWYDINVISDGTIEFSNYTNNDNLVKLNATPNSDGVITNTGAKMDVGYYAPKPDTGVPTEATGLVQYTETASRVKMDIAFGAK